MYKFIILTIFILCCLSCDIPECSTPKFNPGDKVRLKGTDVEVVIEQVTSGCYTPVYGVWQNTSQEGLKYKYIKESLLEK